MERNNNYDQKAVSPKSLEKKLVTAVLIAIHTATLKGDLRNAGLKKVRGMPDPLQVAQDICSCLNCEQICALPKAYFCTGCWALIDKLGIQGKLKSFVSTGPDDFEKKEEEQLKVILCARKLLTNHIFFIPRKKKPYSFSFKAKFSKVYKAASAITRFIAERGTIADAMDHARVEDHREVALAERISAMRLRNSANRTSDFDIEEDQLVCDDSDSDEDEEVKVEVLPFKAPSLKELNLESKRFTGVAIPTTIPESDEGKVEKVEKVVEKSIIRHFPMSDDEDEEGERLTIGDDWDGDVYDFVDVDLLDPVDDDKLLIVNNSHADFVPAGFKEVFVGLCPSFGKQYGDL